MFGDLDLHAMEEADMQDDVKDSIHRYKKTYTSLQNAKDLDSKSLQFLQTSTQLCINSTTFPG